MRQNQCTSTMDKFSYVGNGDVNAINAVYEQFQANPDSVDASWKEFFQGFDFALKQYDGGASAQSVEKEFKVFQLIEGYRTRGHLFTKTNPVRARRPYTDTISAEYYGFTAQDMDTVFHAGNKLGLGAVKLKEIVSFLEDTQLRKDRIIFLHNYQFLLRW